MKKIKEFMSANAWRKWGENKWKSMKKIKEFMGENAWRNKGENGLKSILKKKSLWVQMHRDIRVKIGENL